MLQTVEMISKEFKRLNVTQSSYGKQKNTLKLSVKQRCHNSFLLGVCRHASIEETRPGHIRPNIRNEHSSN